MGNPYTAGASGAAASNPNSGTKYLSESEAREFSLIVGIVGVIFALIGVGLVFGLMHNVLNVLLLAYLTGIGFEYMHTKVAKGGLEPAEIALVALWPVHYGLAVYKKENANTAARANQNDANAIIGEKPATYLGWALLVGSIVAGWFLVHAVLDTALVAFFAALCLYIAGAAAEWFRNDIPAGGVYKKELVLAAVWPLRFIENTKVGKKLYSKVS